MHNRQPCAERVRREKTAVIYGETIYDREALFAGPDYVSKKYQPGYPRTRENDYETYRFVMRPKRISTMWALRGQLLAMGPYEKIWGKNLRDLVYNPSLRPICASGSFAGPLVVPLVRTYTRCISDHFVPPVGYLIFQLWDSAAQRIEPNVFFMVRPKLDINNEKFICRVKGDPVNCIPRDRYRFINTIAQWRPYTALDIPKDIVVYIAETNNRGIDFSNEAVRYNNV